MESSGEEAGSPGSEEDGSPAGGEAGSPVAEEAASPAATGGAVRLFRAQVAYDGGRFHGFQYQPGLPTVQGEIERALRQIATPVDRVQGAGRTDAGVHALGQVCNFQLITRLGPDRLRAALNAHLPPDIRMFRLEEAPVGFSARFSACWRKYRYWIVPREDPFLRGRAHLARPWPDMEAMNRAAASLLGEHEFRSFTTQREGPYGCRVHEAQWTPWGGGMVFTIRSDRFVYQMVRILTGSFLEIGRGRLAPDALERILRQQDRRASGPLAPACGLYLVRVGYEPSWPEDADEAIPLIPR